MTDRQKLVQRIKGHFAGGVRNSSEILFSLLEKGHYQAAVDVMPLVNGHIIEFDKRLEDALTEVAAQDDYYAHLRLEVEMKAKEDAENKQIAYEAATEIDEQTRPVSKTS